MALNKAALAIDPYCIDNFEDVKNIIQEAGADVIRKVETPDCTYMIYYWDYCDDEASLNELLQIIKNTRHAYIAVDENDNMHKDIKTSDEYGCDEEFCEILQYDPDIKIWGEDTVTDNGSSKLQLIDIISLISETAMVKVFDIKDVDNILAEPIAVYNGRDSISESLNDVAVKEINSSVDSIDIYIDAEAAA